MSRVPSIALVLPLLALTSFAQEWTRFRGPNGAGIVEAENVPTEISNRNLRWKVELPGSGHSSPVLWGERLFVTATGDSSGGISLLCLDAHDGKTLWRKDFSLNPFDRHRFNSFASSTPAVDPERVYFLRTEPRRLVLAALSHDGTLLWERNFGTFVSQHGGGTSPIIYDGKVIFGNEHGDSRPGAKSCIIAVDASDGKTVWQTARRNSSTAYSTPCVYEAPGVEPALIFNSEGHGIYAVDPTNGRVLWEYDKAFDKRSVSSPVIAGDIVFGSCGSGGGGNFVSAVRAGDPKTGRKPELAYDMRRSANYVVTPVVKGNLAWLWNDGGMLTCLHAPSGDIRYQERIGGNFFASPIWIDGRLLGVSTAGEVVVVEASDQFKILHRYSLDELCHATPAAALGRLFIRTEKHLWCFGNPNRA